MDKLLKPLNIMKEFLCSEKSDLNYCQDCGLYREGVKGKRDCLASQAFHTGEARKILKELKESVSAHGWGKV